MNEMAHASSGINVYDFATFGYLGAFLLYALHAFFFRQKSVGVAATLLLGASWILHTVFLVERSLFYHAQYQGFVLPATNMFEAISYFAWLVVLLYLIVETGFLKTRLFGVFALIVPAAAMAYTGKWMDPTPRELMPSLKSYWLVFHITAMFISYAAFALAFSFALMYVLRANGDEKPGEDRPEVQPALPGRHHLQAGAVRLPRADAGRLPRRGVGRQRLGPVLGLGSQRDLGADHLVRLPGLPPPAAAVELDRLSQRAVQHASASWRC